jgi:hypothetical protein
MGSGYSLKAVVDIFGVDDDGELAAIANDLLEGVVRANCALFRDYPELPELYTSGVRFRAEPWATMPTAAELALAPSGYRPMPPMEQFCVYPVILRRGWGDCAQLCAVRVAWLRQVEKESDARLRYYVRTHEVMVDDKPQKRRWYHVEVRRGARGDRAIEDPSRRLDF